MNRAGLCHTAFRMHRRLRRVVAWFGLLTVSCAGALEHPERFLPVDAGEPCTVEEVEPVIFATCAGRGCHQPFDGGLGAANDLDLVSPGIKARVRAQTSSCNGLPMATHLLEKIRPDPSCSGDRMPLGRSALSLNQIACVEAWVASVLDGGQR